MKKDNKVVWGIETEMANILNEIDINPDKKVLFTAGENQFFSDNGIIYKMQARKNVVPKQISKSMFNEITNEYKLNCKQSKVKDNIYKDI